MRVALRLRWWLWRQVCRHPNVCPAQAHSLIVWGCMDRRPQIDDGCRTDCTRNGSCWCGKLRAAR